MKRFVLLLAASAILLVPAAPAFAAPAGRSGEGGATSTRAATAQLDGVSRIPPELCFAFFGSDVENLVCSTHG